MAVQLHGRCLVRLLSAFVSDDPPCALRVTGRHDNSSSRSRVGGDPQGALKLFFAVGQSMVVLDLLRNTYTDELWIFHLGILGLGIFGDLKTYVKLCTMYLWGSCIGIFGSTGTIYGSVYVVGS